MKNISKIASEILAGRWQPNIESRKPAVITLRKEDFKNETMFTYLADATGLETEFYKKMKSAPQSDEPESTIDDYEEISLVVTKSELK